MKKTVLSVVSMISVMMITGCSNKEPLPNITKNMFIKDRPKEYTFNYIPIIGTQTPDDKVVVDMGVVLRVWINSYKNRTDDLVSSHDIYMWAKKPDFILGAPLPTRKRGIINSTNRLPFSISDNSVDRSNTKDNMNIRSFVNSVNSSFKKSPIYNVSLKEQKSTKKDDFTPLEDNYKNTSDDKIKHFLKKMKKEI